MGNYLPNSFYKDSGCISENNNCTMKAVALPTPDKRVVRKQICIAPSIVQLQVSAVVSKGNSQIDLKDNNFFLLKTFWNKRSSLPFFSKATPTANKNFEENSVDIYLTSHVERNPSSVRTNSRLSYQHLQFESSTPRTTKTDILEYKSSPCYISKQFIDPDSLFFTTFLSMVDAPQPKNSTNEVSGTNANPAVKHRPGISFFVDLDEPYKQCPLKEEYKFTLYNDCCSLSDSLCSLECDDNDCCSLSDSLCSLECDDNVSCCEEDFIVFEEANDCYQFHVTHARIEHFGKEYTSEDSLVCFKSEESSTGLHYCITSTCSSTNSNQTNNNSVNIVWPNCEQTCEPEFHEHVSKIPSKTCFKKVHFQTDKDLAIVHHMKHWDFAYREARKGPWELAAADRCRFWRRIKDLESVISPCLQRKIEEIKNL